MVLLSGQTKIKLTVDIQAGKLMAIKPTKNVLNENNVFTHDKSTCRLSATLFSTFRYRVPALSPLIFM